MVLEGHVASLPLHQHKQFLTNHIPCAAGWGSLAHEFCALWIHVTDLPGCQKIVGHTSNVQLLGLV